MTVQNRRLISQILVGICIGASIFGCNATNDNPINPDKMNQIRQQETRDRGSFKPQMSSPPASK
jgi:hypothetical protein